MSADALSTTAKKNIEAIAQVERELLGRRSRVEKIGDVIARFFGSLWFIGAHVLFSVCTARTAKTFCSNHLSRACAERARQSALDVDKTKSWRQARWAQRRNARAQLCREQGQ